MSGIMRELPPEAVGPAIGVFLYSSFCCSLSVALLWATIAHREWKSYVALLAFFTSLSTLASMAQQLHTYLRWTSIKLAQFDYVKAHIGDPELSVAGPSVGIDIVFFYIQFYCYNVEAILVASWCTQLAHSIYHLKPSSSVSRYGSRLAKSTAIVLPIIQVNLMRTSTVQSSLIGFYFLANIIMGVSLALGVVLLLAILAKYVSTRTETSWHVRYADRSTVDGARPSVNSLGTFMSSERSVLHQKSIYDNWLIVRFTLAFAGLAAFHLVVILSEVGNAISNDRTADDTTVDLRPDRAVSDVQAFPPGVSGSLLAFVVFGTTKAFREYFYRRLVPRCIRRKIANRGKSPSLIAPAPAPAPRRPSRPTDSTMYPPAARMTPWRTSAAAFYPTGPEAMSPGVECFELDGCEAGPRHERSDVHELPMPTPTHSTFEVHKQSDEEEDQWPILNNKPPR